jgi:hypothetical protein
MADRELVFGVEFDKMGGVWCVHLWQREGKRRWAGQHVTVEMKEIDEFSPAPAVFALGPGPLTVLVDGKEIDLNRKKDTPVDTGEVGFLRKLTDRLVGMIESRPKTE